MPQPVHVLIPAALRPQVGQQASISLEGDSVRAVLAALGNQYPDFARRLFKDGGELNRFVNVYVNDEDIRFLDNLDTALKGGEEVAIVPAIAGG